MNQQKDIKMVRNDFLTTFPFQYYDFLFQRGDFTNQISLRFKN